MTFSTNGGIIKNREVKELYIEFNQFSESRGDEMQNFLATIVISFVVGCFVRGVIIERLDKKTHRGISFLAYVGFYVATVAISFVLIQILNH